MSKTGVPDGLGHLARGKPNAAGIAIAAAVTAAAVAYGYAQRARRIRAEQQLDIVTEAALEVRGLLRTAAPEPEHPARTPAPLRALGKDDNEVTPDQDADAPPGDQPSSRR